MNYFGRQLESIFAQAGRRWKSAAADALAISRPTLYRYISLDEDALAIAIPSEILDRVRKLVRQTTSLPPARDLAVYYARGLTKLQEYIDRNGFISAPYPPELLRAFSIASALNSRAEDTKYPDDLASLLECAAQPFHEWFVDLHWDHAGDYTTAQLIRHGVISAECTLLASTPEDIDEREGYDLLMNRCRPLPNGQELYVAWRRLLIEYPVIESFAEVVRSQRIFLRNIEAVTELDQQFLERVPRPLTDAGTLSLCPITGTRATFFEHEWVSESRDPDVQIQLKASGPRRIQWTPDTRQVKRTFRQFWVLPGYYEIDLYRHATAAGWDAELWPKFDTVDLVLRKGDRALALDVKDHINSVQLAKRFEGFRGYERDHRCFVVVPDYLTRIDSRYRARFNAVRRSQGKLPVDVKTYADILEIIESEA
jgi:hypothetical protein